MCKVCVVCLIQYKREIYSHIEKHTTSYIYILEREADDLRGQKKKGRVHFLSSSSLFLDRFYSSSTTVHMAQGMFLMFYHVFFIWINCMVNIKYEFWVLILTITWWLAFQSLWKFNTFFHVILNASYLFHCFTMFSYRNMFY